MDHVSYVGHELKSRASREMAQLNTTDVSVLNSLISSNCKVKYRTDQWKKNNNQNPNEFVITFKLSFYTIDKCPKPKECRKSNNSKKEEHFETTKPDNI